MNPHTKIGKSDGKPANGSPEDTSTSGGGKDLNHVFEEPSACSKDPDEKNNDKFANGSQRCDATSAAETNGKDVRPAYQDPGDCCEDPDSKSNEKPACVSTGGTVNRGAEDGCKALSSSSENIGVSYDIPDEKSNGKPTNGSPRGATTSGSEANEKAVKPLYEGTVACCEDLDVKSYENPASEFPGGPATSVAKDGGKYVKLASEDTGAICENPDEKSDRKPVNGSSRGATFSGAEVGGKDLRTASIFFYRSPITCCEDQENTGQSVDKPEEILKIFDLYRYSTGGHLGDAEGLSKKDVKIWLKAAGLMDGINGCSEEDFDTAYDKAVDGMKSLHFSGFKKLIENLCQQKKIEPHKFFDKMVAVGPPKRHEEMLNNCPEQVE